MAFTILGSMVLPFGTLKQALAVDGKTVLQAPTANGDYCGANYCTLANNLRISQVGGDATGKISAYSDTEIVRLEITIDPDGSSYMAKDQPSGAPGAGELNWADLEGTAFDGFYDLADFNGAVNGGGTRDDGFFLQIGTSKEVLLDTDTNKSSERINDSTNIDNFSLRHYQLEPTDPQSLYSLPRKTSDPGDNAAVEILKVLTEYPEKFYNKNAFAVTVAISNLQPDTKYYAQLVAEESSSDNYFWSNVLEFRTKAAAEENKFGATPISQDIIDSANTPPEQGSANAFTAELWCTKAPFSVNVGGCFTILFNDIFVSTAHWLAQQTGRLFDAFAAVSLGSTIYGQGTAGADIASFVENGWSLVRNIANIFFIFILLYAALSLVLSLHLHGTSVKKLVSQVIIVALLINFSLFFCRVTIDASNILSRVFYNAMDISTKGNNPTTADAGSVKEQSISAAIIGGVQPQKLLNEDSLAKLKENGTVTTGTIFMVLFISFILNIVMAWIFFMCAAFFAGRIGVIWFSMIFAPLAFVTSIVPDLDHQFKQLGWTSWLKSFTSACFKAPIFFFFLYLIVNLVGGENGGLLGSTIGAVTNLENGSWVAFLVAILLPTMIIVGLLMAAKKLAEEMAGEFGATFAGVVAAGAGLAAMVGTGGAAALGARFIGGRAATMAADDKLKDMASGKVRNKDGTTRDATKFEKWSAQQKLRAANSLKSASFDARQTGLGNMLSSTTNVNMNTGSGLLKGVTGAASAVTGVQGLQMDLSTGARAGGYAAMADRKAAKINEDGKIFGSGYNKEEYAAEEKKMKDRETEIASQKETVSRGEEEISKLRADAEGHGKNTPQGKAILQTASTKQAALNVEKQKLRRLENGSGDRVVTGTDPKTGNAITRPITKADLGKTLKIKNRNGLVFDREVTDDIFENSRGLSSMQKNLESIKTARLKQFHLSTMEEHGRHVHGTKRDELGNITDVGHLDSERALQTGKRIGSNLIKDWGSNLMRGAQAGLAGAVVGGPIGMGVGFLAGSLSGSVKEFGNSLKAMGDIQGEAMHHVTSTEKHEHAHYKDSYKSPSSKFFDLFKGFGGGGGGGGDHGGGHDDHGGGHH